MAPGVRGCGLQRGKVEDFLSAEMVVLNALALLRGFNRGGDGHEAIQTARVEGSILVLCTVEHDVYRVARITMDARDNHHHATCG